VVDLEENGWTGKARTTQHFSQYGLDMVRGREIL
jgi:hypothetical protein